MQHSAVFDLDTVVVGGGVIGLAIARTLARRGHEVVLLEQHEVLGGEVSSRNSEVIHAGIYYPPGSLRARLCVEGKRQLYRFVTEHGVPHARLGKLLVAATEDELPGLAKYEATAQRNGLDDVLRLTAAGARALEPEVRCAGALLSPSTGIVDSHALMLALAGDAEAHGAQVVLRSKIIALQPLPGGGFSISVAGARGTPVTARRLVLAAGLHTSGLARQMNLGPRYRVPDTYYARGRYYALRGRSPFQHLVYPMPQSGGLGIHLTLDMQGQAKFGPDVVWIPAIDYGFDDTAEAHFYAAIRHYWPGLADGRLQPAGTGIRPKLTQAGEAAADFAIHGQGEHGVQGLVMLFGIESPGLTASFAIADQVAALLAGASAP